MIKIILSVLILFNVTSILYLGSLTSISILELNIGNIFSFFQNNLLATSVIDFIGILLIYATTYKRLTGFKDQLTMIPKGMFLSLCLMVFSMGEATMFLSKITNLSISSQGIPSAIISHLYVLIAFFIYSLFTSNITNYGRELFVFIVKHLTLSLVLIIALYFISKELNMDIYQHIVKYKNSFNFDQFLDFFKI